MKKKLPLILSILGIVIILSASAAVYKMYFERETVKATGTPLVAPVTQPGRPLPQLPKTPGPVNAAGAGVETKRPNMPAAGALQKVDVSPNSYEYNAKGRRDPFAPLIVKAEPERKKSSIPIKNYSVNEFRLRAVLWSKSGRYALVSAPDGKNFALREGTIVGLHGGKVDKILKDSVIIKEFLKDYRGVVKPNYTVLKLHREEE